MTLSSFILTCAIIALVPLVALILQFVERKVLADFQVRLGPTRVGPYGLLQPVADAIKLLLKEDIIPADAERSTFWAAPMVATFAALVSFVVLPFSQSAAVIDVNVGVLIISAAAAVGVLGIILGGWSSNSHYPLLGALRSAAQLISYEIALGFALLSGLMVAGTLSMQGIVHAQQERHIWFLFGNYGFMMLPFLIFLVSITAESNRAPFDLPEAESELVGGYHTEYSGLRWALFMLAEYANLLVASSLGVTLFLGGWLRPFPNTAWLAWPLNTGVPVVLFAGSGVGLVILARRLRLVTQRALLMAVAVVVILVGLAFLVPPVNTVLSGPFWFFSKLGVLIYLMIWFRATFPRLRYDQLMRLGWHWMIPAGMVCVLVNAVLGLL